MFSCFYVVINRATDQTKKHYTVMENLIRTYLFQVQCFFLWKLLQGVKASSLSGDFNAFQWDYCWQNPQHLKWKPATAVWSINGALDWGIRFFRQFASRLYNESIASLLAKVDHLENAIILAKLTDLFDDIHDELVHLHEGKKKR